MMTVAQLEDLYGPLTDADADGNAEALAKLCWQLYTELGQSITLADQRQARFSALVCAVRAVAGGVGAHDGGHVCPGCDTPGQAVACVWCGQLQDPCYGHGLEHTPPSADADGLWRCSSCRAIVAEDPRLAGSPS
jgi:hypothetical protein